MPDPTTCSAATLTLRYRRRRLGSLVAWPTVPGSAGAPDPQGPAGSRAIKRFCATKIGTRRGLTSPPDATAPEQEPGVRHWKLQGFEWCHLKIRALKIRSRKSAGEAWAQIKVVVVVTACTALRGGRGRSSRIGLGSAGLWLRTRRVAALSERPHSKKVQMRAATACSTISSPTPVAETAPKRLAKFAATVGVSETRWGYSKPLPPVDVAAARPRFRSRATAPTVPESPCRRRSGIGAGAWREGRGERESAFAGKLAGAGFGQHAVSTRLEEFGQPNRNSPLPRRSRIRKSAGGGRPSAMRSCGSCRRSGAWIRDRRCRGDRFPTARPPARRLLQHSRRGRAGDRPAQESVGGDST